MNRPDECPIGGDPCQSLCETPCTTSREIDRLNRELQKRDKCAFMGPMRDCPTHGESARLRELETALEQAVESFDIISDRLMKYQCEGRGLDSIHDVFEVARMGQSLRVLLMPNVEVTGDGRLHGRRPSEPQG